MKHLGRSDVNYYRRFVTLKKTYCDRNVPERFVTPFLDECTCAPCLFVMIVKAGIEPNKENENDKIR